MAQHHFLVVFDTETGEWFRDDDTLEVMLAGGPIYEPETDEWRDVESQDESDYDIQLGEQLDNRLE